MAKKASKKAATNRMNMIQSVAKKLWATGKYKKYSDAVKKASDQLKKEGKL
jgi:hypothetical protein